MIRLQWPARATLAARATPFPLNARGPFTDGWIARRVTEQEVANVFESGNAEYLASAQKARDGILLESGVDILPRVLQTVETSRCEAYEFLSGAQPGDEFWYFSNPPRSPSLKGYSIVRGGREIERRVTAFF